MSFIVFFSFVLSLLVLLCCCAVDRVVVVILVICCVNLARALLLRWCLLSSPLV